MSVFDGDIELTTEQVEQLVVDEIARRRGEINPRDLAAAVGLGSISANEARKFSHQQAGKAIMDEYQDIRRDPERQARQMNEMARTYQQYVERTGNPVEAFIPVKNTYAAATLDDGTDVVMFDPSAPHAGIMAHELGHIDMNHSSDPIAYLQTSGLGRSAANNAVAFGAGGALIGGTLGQAISRLNRRPNHLLDQGIGTALGGIGGAVASSGQTIYELGASARGLGYLPDDLDKMDVVGDLGRAGSTYFMGGPGEALTTAAGVGGAALLAMHPAVRRKAGDMFNRPASV